MGHSKKDKSDFAVGTVIADLMRQGFKICVPIAELPIFDLIAINNKMCLARIQVRYTSERKKGRIQIKLCNSSQRRKRTVTHTLDRSLFDGFAVYAEAMNRVYYVPNSAIPTHAREMFSFRYVPTQGPTHNLMRVAEEFEKADALFDR